jgi:adenylate cyclase
MLGQEEEARAAAAEVLRINPRFTLKAYAAHIPYISKEYTERKLTAFRKAGLPE